MTKSPTKILAYSEVLFEKFSEIWGYTRLSVAILLLVSLLNSGEAKGQIVPNSYNASLAWDAHIDSTVTAYRVYYGTVSENYTTSINVENQTTVTIPNLESGIVYFFAITAINSSGLESGISNQVSFQPGQEGISIQLAANGAPELSVKGLIGQKYDLEATEDLVTWSVIDTFTIGEGGSQKITDPNAIAFPTRFYRTRVSP